MVLSSLFYTFCLLYLMTCGGDIVIGHTGPRTGNMGPLGQQLVAGLGTAFSEANDAGGVHGQNITLIALDDMANSTIAAENLFRLVYEMNVLAVAAVWDTTGTILFHEAAVDARVPYVGTVSGLDHIRSPFEDVFVNLRSSWSDESIALAAFLVQGIQVRFISCIFPDRPSWEGNTNYLTKALASVGIEFIARVSYAEGLDPAGWALIVEAALGGPNKPQAILIFGLPTAATRLLQLAKDHPALDPSCIFVINAGGYYSSQVFPLSAKYRRNVYYALMTPSPVDASSAIAKRYRDATVKYGAPEDRPDIFGFEAYIVGRFLVDVLRRTKPNTLTRQAILDTIYNVHAFVLDDLTLGLYGRHYPGCQSLICGCNQGLRRIHIAEVDEATGVFLPARSLPYWSFPATSCSASIDTLKRPLVFLQLVPAKEAVWQNLANRMSAGIKAAFSEANAAGMANGRPFLLIQIEYDGNYSTAAAEAVKRYPLDGFLGNVVLSSQHGQALTTNIAEFHAELPSEEPAFSAQNLRLQPTLALECMALLSYAISRQLRPIYFAAPNTKEGLAVLAVLQRSIRTFRATETGVILYDDPTTLLSGVGRGAIAAYGTADSVRYWIDSLSEFPFIQLLVPSPMALPLLVTHNLSALPHASRLFIPWLTYGRVATVAPSADIMWQYGYIAGHMTAYFIDSCPGIPRNYTTPNNVMTAFYTIQTFRKLGLHIGPYTRSDCASNATSCSNSCNIGARQLAIIPALDSSCTTAPAYSSSGCSIEYIDWRDPTALIAASSAGGSFLLLLFIVFLVFSLRKKNRRNNSHAPKDSAKPFCILFTDIESSTAFWAMDPGFMAAAIDMHHTLVRGLIKKHHGYEVKTIGDSFMVAFQLPHNGVAFAVDLQSVLYNHDWGSSLFDEFYRQKYADGKEETEKEPDEDYFSKWKGVRVRVGVHLGRGQIRYDPITQGYDYYGSVVNEAARIEAACHGGQVGVSQAVYDALGGMYEDSDWLDLGCHPLRGIPAPVHIYQVLPSGPLSRRDFAPLRLEKAETALTSLVDTPPPMVIGTPLGRNAANLLRPERHPLVTQGKVSAEALETDYNVSMTILQSLFSAMPETFVDSSLTMFAQRLNTCQFGYMREKKNMILHGLVCRVLPAIVNQRLDDASVVSSLSPQCTPSPPRRLFRNGTTRIMNRQPSNLLETHRDSVLELAVGSCYASSSQPISQPQSTQMSRPWM